MDAGGRPSVCYGSLVGPWALDIRRAIYKKAQNNARREDCGDRQVPVPLAFIVALQKAQSHNLEPRYTRSISIVIGLAGGQQRGLDRHVWNRRSNR
jgi:hypothetical protein